MLRLLKALVGFMGMNVRKRMMIMVVVVFNCKQGTIAKMRLAYNAMGQVQFVMDNMPAAGGHYIPLRQAFSFIKRFLRFIIHIDVTKQLQHHYRIFKGYAF